MKGLISHPYVRVKRAGQSGYDARLALENPHA